MHPDDAAVLRQGRTMDRHSLFLKLETWFILQRRENEQRWAEIVEKYGSDPLFGRHLKYVGHQPETELPDLTKLVGQLRWCYEGPWASKDTFFFNCVGRDLSRDRYNRIRRQLASILGTPDNIFEYYGLSEPSWTNGNSIIQLYHVDSHGEGYERFEASVDSGWLKSA